jgi:hypothetical protein
VDRAAKTALHEQRQSTAMVDVCVINNAGIDLVRFEGEGTSIPLGGIVPTLDQTAIEQYAAARHVQHVT